MARFKVRENVVALNAVTTGNSGGFALNDATVSEHYFNWPSVVTGGAVQVEVSNSINGPWDPRGAPVTAPNSGVAAIQCVRLDESVEFARHRVTTAVTGGSVSSNYSAWM